MIDIAGRNYVATVGSDIQRDGMYLEVEDDAKSVLAEVFYDDGNGRMSFTAYRADLPLPLVEWMIGYAKERLVPMVQPGS